MTSLLDVPLDKLPDKAPEYDLRELLAAGCHFGHSRAKRNPLMSEWLYTEKDGVYIFDLAKTAAQLRLAYNAAYHLGSQGKNLVFIGTKRQAAAVLGELATEHEFLHVTSRWLGGLLTNWRQVSKSLKRMLEIEKGLDSGKYKGYTKYEIVQLEKELNRFRRFFSGLRSLQAKPDALFVVDSVREQVAVNEARLEGVPVIALIDSNADPRGITIPVPANDDAIKSIRYITQAVVEGYIAGRKEKKS